MRWNITSFIRPISLTIIVMVVFGNTVRNSFVWDDHLFVTFNEAYRNMDLDTILFSLKANGVEYLPVRDLSYVLDFAIWGKSSFGFHFSNLILHWLNVIGVYFLALRLVAPPLIKTASDIKSNPENIAFVTAALFAVHPIQCEAVNFITCRNVLLSGVFFLVSCNTYLRFLTGTDRRTYTNYVIALISFLLALFSKATTIILPLILLLFSIHFSEHRFRRRLIPLLPFFTISGVAFFLFKNVAAITRVIQSEPAHITSSPLLAKMALAVQIPLFYLYKIIVPLGFSVDYGTEQFSETMTAPRPLVSLSLILCVATVVWLYRRRFPLIIFCFLWYLIALIPVLHLFATVPVVADRYAFLPSVAPFLFITVSIAHIKEKNRSWQMGIVVAVVLCLSFLSFKQSMVWKNATSLWEHTIKVSPHSSTALVNLARICFVQEKNYGKALSLAKRAQEINSSEPSYDIFSGELFLKSNDPQGAFAAFNRALLRAPDNVETLVNLGRTSEVMGNKSMAKDFYLRAINSTEPYLPNDMRERAKIMFRNLERNP